MILLHGFPYDPRAYDGVAPGLAARGCRVIVPYLRGYGPMRFIDEGIMRSDQQAALAQDLLDLMDALFIERAVLAGSDWGGCANRLFKLGRHPSSHLLMKKTLQIHRSFTIII